jgi:hypothetical protein
LKQGEEVRAMVRNEDERAQHKLHWLAEQALNWSGLPVVHVRPTVFLDGFFLIFISDSVRKSNQISLPSATGVFEGARAHDHLSGHSGLAVAGRVARARLPSSRSESPPDDGRSAPSGTLRPNVGRRAHANGATGQQSSSHGRIGMRLSQTWDSEGDVYLYGK